MSGTRKLNFGDWPVLGVVVLLAGLVGSFKCPAALGQRFSEALIIAGVLAITVDPYIKRRLLHEASVDIFHHLIGFSLPGVIQDRIKSIVLNTKLYRKDMDLICTFVRVSKGVRIDWEYKFEVVNPSSEKVPFRQRFEFEKLENATLKSISCSAKPSEYGRDPRLHESKNDPDLRVFDGPRVNIAPEREGRKVIFRAEYSTTRPVPDVYTQHFVLPTTGLTLIVKDAGGLRVSASPADSQPGTGQWIYNQLFMPGEHIEIRWEESTDALTQA